jgi:ribose 1,5-bisphosphokinase
VVGSGCSSAKQGDASGRLVLVVGPSGAGKDAIIASVRHRLAGNPRFVFPSRIITRPHSAAEANEAVCEDEFEALVRRRAVALHWEAHGLHYGLPASIDDDVKRGCTVVFNASRQIVSAAKVRYACAVVYIDAPVQIRAQRLAARSRERAEDIAKRLARVVADFDACQADLVIDNGASLAKASESLMTWLLSTNHIETRRPIEFMGRR